MTATTLRLYSDVPSAFRGLTIQHEIFLPQVGFFVVLLRFLMELVEIG